MQFKTLLTAVFFSGSTLAFSIFNLNSANTEAQPKYFKLNAQKFTRSNLDNVYYDDVQKKLFKRDDDSEQVSMDLDHERTFYSTELEIGSPSQRVKVLVDTASSDLWVFAPNNSFCESGTTGSLNNKMRALDDDLGEKYSYKTSLELAVQHKPVDSVTETNYQYENTVSDYSIQTAASLPDAASTYSPSSGSGSSNNSEIDCSIYGTFDPDSSDSFVSNGTSFYITYADSTYARGTWGHDDISIGDYSVKGLSFAVANDTDKYLGMLGIGLSGLESTNQYPAVSTSYYQYENLPLKLKSDGYINMVAYSIYLNSDSSDEDASVLFGAIDHNKYTGDLVALPIVDPVEYREHDNPIYTYITLNSISIVNTSSSREGNIGSGATPALLDTGSTLSYFPYRVYRKIITYFSAEHSSSLDGYIMRCSDADNHYINFNFQGKEINVPFSSFMVSLNTSSNSASSYCMVGILSNGGSKNLILGDNFIRNVYFIQDFENYEIILGDVNHNDDENIEIFTSTIPNVARTASTSAWSTSSQSLTVPSSIEMHAYTSSSSTEAGSTTSTTSTSSSEDTGTSESSESSSTASVSSISSTDSNNGANGRYNDNNLYGFTISFLFFIVSLL